MTVKRIQVTAQEVIIPLTYFPQASELELVVNDDVAVVRPKTVVSGLHQNERREEMLQETAAFEAQRAKLIQDYLGEYVAFHNGELVDHDPDHTRIIRRIQKQYPGQIVLIRQVTEEAASPLRLGSPRLANL
jgi:hypothetical protein